MKGSAEMKEENLTKLQERIFQDYEKRTPRSKQMFERASKSLAGGVVGSPKFFYPYPLYMTHSKGSKQYDVDGHEYVDCYLEGGPLLLGHCPKPLMEAIKRDLDKGLMVYNSEAQIECAELLKEVIPCAEMVRLANTGTEAVINAVRLARSFTGKNKIIKFFGHYHGQDDQFLIAIANDKPGPSSLGVPKEALANTVMARWNDIDDVRRKLDEDKDIAGIIMDPQGNMGGIWPAQPEFLRELRKLTEERGIVLIFDEVITGFRLALGGAQEYFGVVPDIACYAKAAGAGGKFAALVGKAKIMNLLATKGFYAFGEKETYIGGTYVTGSVAISAAIAAIKTYKELSKTGGYKKLFDLSAKLKTGIESAFRRKGIPCVMNMLGPSFKLFITDQEPNFETYYKLGKKPVYLFFVSTLTDDVFLGNPASGVVFLSFAHTEKDIQRALDGVNTCLDKYDFTLAL